MSPRDLAFIGCRLLALYVFLSVVQAQIYNVFFYLQALDASATTGVVQNTEFDLYFWSALINLGICFVLWFGAGWFAGKVAAGPRKPQEQAPVVWSHRSALSIVVIAVGLFVLILLAPNVAYILNQVFQRGYVEFISLAYMAVAIVVGLVCIFSPRAIAGFIARTRRW